MNEHNIKIEIDNKAGFCQGVVNAIRIAENELKKGEKIYCLGDIVHNKTEVERLQSLGLITINYEEFETLSDCKVIVRAHGEPPSTFKTAKERSITIIDATCSIVFKLQQEIKESKSNLNAADSEIIIVGKQGHPEVLGLLGQVEGKAMVISSVKDLETIEKFRKNLLIFSQTTMDKNVYADVIREISLKAECRKIGITNSICKHVLNRKDSIISFARNHDIVFFVSSSNSSNGMYLFNICKKENPNTFLLNSAEEIDFSLLPNIKSIGVSGATSTPMWLMEQVAERIDEFLSKR
ncbi:MAG: 4-hydroxy-3-methylbut-2-enyl diphosphate reductase [Bacteroidales bacterium]|jgi:4-hydroxy-3-methylbut-2-enyl diphosphate reductase|nr:4-hydroxy-3-methylbut-2-enyl diphosphate reductase [Bacteroidales bacterium]